MKKVLFLIGNLQGGGAEKVLCNVVKYLDKSKYDITVMTIQNSGVYVDEVSKYATYTTLFPSLKPGNHIFKKMYNIIRLKIRGLICTLPTKYLYKIYIGNRYDIEIAFLEDKSTKIIANSTNRKSKKYTWVHTDLEKSNWGLCFYKSEGEQRECYKRFDKIICVSDSAKDAFIRKFNMDINVEVLYNPLDEQTILNRSLDVCSLNEKKSKFRVITIGRLVSQKGYDRLLRVHKRLISEGYNYELLILGEGGEQERLEKYIKDYNLKDSVKMLGFISNPYPYIKSSDLFICSSRVEGFSLVVAEALILGVPVISTNCKGPSELLGFGKYGLLTDNNTEALYNGLKTILSSNELYASLKENAIIRGKDFKIKQRIREIENLIDL